MGSLVPDSVGHATGGRKMTRRNPWPTSVTAALKRMLSLGTGGFARVYAFKKLMTSA